MATLIHSEIIEGVTSAADLVESLIADGTYELSESSDGPFGPMVAAYSQYQLHCAQVLAKFVEGEEDAAFWTQVELYAGFLEPAEILHAGKALVVAGSRTYTLPRVLPLVDWAAGGPQPRYGLESTPPDTIRYSIVAPGSTAPPDMVWAPILRTW